MFINGFYENTALITERYKEIPLTPCSTFAQFQFPTGMTANGRGNADATRL